MLQLLLLVFAGALPAVVESAKLFCFRKAARPRLSLGGGVSVSRAPRMPAPCPFYLGGVVGPKDHSPGERETTVPVEEECEGAIFSSFFFDLCNLVERQGGVGVGTYFRDCALW